MSATAGGLVLTPAPGGPSGTITYRERRRPLAALEDLVADAGLPSGFTVRATQRASSVTIEGELTELVILTGELAGVAAELCLGFVVLDDCYARFTSVAYGEASHAPVRAVVRDLLGLDRHLLGQIRRRWYAFTAPPGWRERRELFVAQLEGPRAAELRVVAAVPRAPGLEAEIVGRVLRGAEVATEITTPRGLRGRIHARPGAVPGAPEVAFVEDAHFAYVVRSARTDRARLDGLLASIQPIRLSAVPVAAPGDGLRAHQVA